MNMISSAHAKELTASQQDALALTLSALEIARSFEAKNPNNLATALDKNLKLWVGIRTLVAPASNSMPIGIKDNLIRLSSYVAQKTFEMENGVKATAKVIDALVNINLQISEGLLSSK